jgi:hypothetical protein
MVGIAEKMFAVAVRDGADLFLWIRIRRAASGIYYVFATGREGESEWNKWNPHGSYHKDGHFHHKSFDQKMLPPEQHQKPDAAFQGTKQMVTRPISSDEPRLVGVICDQTKFDEVMEVPVSMLSSKKYETNIAVDVTEPGGQAIITPGGHILLQHTFDDAIPWFLVTLFSWWPASR